MLQASDPPPFTWFNREGRAPCLIVCDHASNAIPRGLEDLGLDPDHLEQHIAWDIGAACIAQRLARRFDAPLLLAGYSRLVADCNRYPDDPAAFIEVSDTIPVGGNSGLGEDDRRRRLEAVWHPYHDAIEAALGDRAAPPAFISVHTMTRCMRGKEPRPEAFTVCWSRDDRLATPILERLRSRGDIVVGDNQPYGLDIGEDYTVPEHAMRRGLAHLQFEVRQDLVSSPDDAAHWADLVHDLAADLVADASLRQERHVWP
ncbi:MAG: N-formylglutamate amidohydrolase [bacterium]|nr:N-formylglutamate amidohydrolase [bacterium]MDE0416231.1 N-formylglutamate amidohydrolase [bacterium]